MTEELAEWASTVRLDDVPGRVVRYAKSQIISQLAAARASREHPLGARVIQAFGEPLQVDPKQAATVLAGLTSWLHFDDTAFAGHISNSTVTVPVAYALALGLDGPELLTAIIAANECAARITAAATLGPFRGQNAAHTHLAGALCGRLRSEAAPAPRWVDAFGIAFALAPWPVQHGFLGSDAKVLSAFTPVRIGLDACDAAAAGMRGAADILEHPDGFLARFASVPLPEAVTCGLGERWHTESLSFKMHPGGPGVDAAVDCAAALHAELRASRGAFRVADVAEVIVDAPLYTVMLDERVARYIDGARSPVSALVFSTPYTVATTLLTGELVAGDFAAPRLDDPLRWALASRVELRHDIALTRESMQCEVPFGEALRQAGPRAGAWLAEVGGTWLVDLVGEIPPPSTTFETARKATGATVTVVMRDGTSQRRSRAIPLGAVGPDTRRRHPELVRQKFLATGGAAEVADGLADLEAMSATDVKHLLSAALDPRS